MFYEIVNSRPVTSLQELAGFDWVRLGSHLHFTRFDSNHPDLLEQLVCQPCVTSEDPTPILPARVEVERAKGRGCLTRSVKLAQLMRYFSFSAEAVTIARSATPLRACPRRSTWPITRRPRRSWQGKLRKGSHAALRPQPLVALFRHVVASQRVRVPDRFTSKGGIFGRGRPGFRLKPRCLLWPFFA